MRTRFGSLALALTTASTAVLATLVVAPAVPAAAAPVTINLDCRSIAPIIGNQYGTQTQTIDVAAPAQVLPGATFQLTTTSAVGNIASNQGAGTISSIKNLSMRFPVPANATYVSGSLSGGFNYGPGTPTITLQGSNTAGTLLFSIPGPIPADQNFQFPSLSLTFTATGPDHSTIVPRLGGSSYDDPGFTTTAVATSPISADVPTSCFPIAPNPALSTTTIVPLDTAPPVIALNTPADGGMYPQGGNVAASYTCDDGPFGSGVASCDGDVAAGSPIDTSTLGTFSFTVTASDANGNAATPVTHTYSVVPGGFDDTPPQIDLAAPANGATYLQGTTVGASYSCTDDSSGVATCAGDVATGVPIDTSAVGPRTFTVTATDNEGNPHTVVHSYRVLPAGVQQNWVAGDVTNRLPVDCDTLFGAFNESIPVTSNVAPVQTASGAQFAWDFAIGQDVIPTLNNGTNLLYRWKAPQGGHFVSAAFTGPGFKVNGPTIGVAANGMLELRIASVVDSSFLGFGDDPFTPPPFRAIVQADGGAGSVVRNQFDYFQLTTTFGGTSHCPAGEPNFSGRINPILTNTTVVDATPPAVTLSSPVHGQTYAPGASVLADFACTDDAGVPSCVGTVPNGSALDTSTSGTYEFSVASLDAAGNAAATHATYTIGDPSVSVTDASPAVEGPAASLAFDVTLSNPSSEPVTVTYQTTGQSATAPGDFVNASDVLTFEPGGPLTQTVTVQLVDDLAFEEDESLTLELVSAIGATIADGSGAGSITDDDPPAVAVADATATEGASASLAFDVTLAADPNFPVTLAYTTSDGTATAGSDYTATAGSLLFEPGGPLAQTVTVPVLDDTAFEGTATAAGDETVFLTVTTSTTGATAGATGTITENDPRPPIVQIGSTAMREGDAYNRAAKLVVTLNRPSTANVTVPYTTIAGSATTADYKAKTATLLFKPGQVTKTVSITTVADTIAEGDHAFTVRLTAASGALLGDRDGEVLLRDDDAPTAAGIEMAVSDVSVYETSPLNKNTTLVFTISLNRRPTTTVSATYAVQTVSAAPSTDFTPKPAKVISFTPTQQAKTLAVTVKGDSAVEPDELLRLVLSNPSAGLTITDAVGDGTIRNDD